MCSVTNNVQEIIFSYISSKIARFCLVSHEFPLEGKKGEKTLLKQDNMSNVARTERV